MSSPLLQPYCKCSGVPSPTQLYTKRQKEPKFFIPEGCPHLRSLGTANLKASLMTRLAVPRRKVDRNTSQIALSSGPRWLLSGCRKASVSGAPVALSPLLLNNLECLVERRQGCEAHMYCCWRQDHPVALAGLELRALLGPGEQVSTAGSLGLRGLLPGAFLP